MLRNRNLNKLKINVISSSLYQILVMIVPIVTSPYVTRIFSINQMGIYSLSLTIANFFVVFAQFGLSTYAIREIAILKTKEERSKVFFKLETLQIITSVLSFVIYSVWIILIVDSENRVLYFIQSLLILINVFDISWFFIGIEEIGKVIIRNGISKLLSTLLIFLVIKSNNHLEFYALINILGILLGNLIMVLQSREYIDFSLAKITLSKNHFIGSFKFLSPNIINSSYDTLEKSILNGITTPGNVGVYSEAKKIINLITSVVNSAFNALSPRMSYHVSEKDYDTVKNYFEKGVFLSSVFSVIIVGGVVAVSYDFVSFFYGEGYYLVSPVLNYSSISLIAIPLNVLLARGILIPYGKDNVYFKSVIVTITSGIALNFILDYQLGAIGAAISFSVAQFVSFVYVLINVKQIIDVKKVLISVLFIIVSIIMNIYIMSFIKTVVNINNSFLSFFVLGFISVLVSIFISCMYFWYVIKNNDNK